MEELSQTMVAMAATRSMGHSCGPVLLLQGWEWSSCKSWCTTHWSEHWQCYPQQRTAVAQLEPILIMGPCLFLCTYPAWVPGLSRDFGTYQLPFSKCLSAWINQKIWLIWNMSKVTAFPGKLLFMLLYALSVVKMNVAQFHFHNCPDLHNKSTEQKSHFSAWEYVN